MTLNRKNKKNKTLLLIQCILAIVFVSSGIKIITILNDYRKSEKLYDDLAQNYVVINTDIDSDKLTDEKNTNNNDISNNSQGIDATDGDDDTTPYDNEELLWEKLVDVHFDGLMEMNSDIVGWMYFENEDISYPIMYSGDNEEYLRKTFDKKSAVAGSIFLDGANNDSFEDFHSIIYGHNMRNLTMFGRLKYYIREKNYYENHKYFQIITPDKKYRCKIFSVYTVKPDNWVYGIKNCDEKTRTELINEMIDMSKVKCEDVIDKNIKIITLSTCRDENRLLINAYIIDECANER